MQLFVKVNQRGMTRRNNFKNISNYYSGNHWTIWNHTLLEPSMDGLSQNVRFLYWSQIQDGHHSRICFNIWIIRWAIHTDSSEPLVLWIDKTIYKQAWLYCSVQNVLHRTLHCWLKSNIYFAGQFYDDGWCCVMYVF